MVRLEEGSGTSDYSDRRYLSAGEAANFLGTTVRELHRLVRESKVPVTIAGSGQQRFDIAHLREMGERAVPRPPVPERTVLEVNGTRQEVLCRGSQSMGELEDGSVHLVVTSPPYFDTKMYSPRPLRGDLGDVHSVDDWFDEIGRVWSECYRVLQPGRRAFINIMNLPVRQPDGGYRTLNLVGRTIDRCEELGFVFKRDIVWHKTNGVRAPFGTYPYPGGILINNMHEFILELEKPIPRALRPKKYAHVPAADKEASRLDKEFWLSIKNSDVWLMAPQASGDRRDHIAPFPAELPARLIRAFTFKGETVLDPFLGSGTTLLAAAALGRNGAGYEINPHIAGSAVEALKKRA
ncbi:DNA-methyltransferase [Methanomassiliicoccus luminyensis]|uniref:DNA-methyltransferase n=1 Tax=Methanomassiliicoccus luminyensis TaxID=1080712 RepID=UPI0011CAD290|nr:site-specific DNA-methyltransferase [Methanomassiliicoccus luminyensis]